MGEALAHTDELALGVWGATTRCNKAGKRRCCEGERQLRFSL